MVKKPEYSNALYAARCVADHAVQVGLLSSGVPCRPVYRHMGAVLADSILQAGLNYEKVVKPRVASILKMFPHASNVNTLIEVIEAEGSRKFLRWEHGEKITRFDSLVAFLAEAKIIDTYELGEALTDGKFRADIQRLRGIGPKTVDYMACLVGADCIAVDRHIRGFAKYVGLEDSSYEYLRDVFCFAADLLCISRRDFDSSVWHHQVLNVSQQLYFEYAQ